MEGERNHFEYVLVGEAIVLAQHVEHCFFVTQEAIGGEMVVDYLLCHLLELDGSHVAEEGQSIAEKFVLAMLEFMHNLFLVNLLMFGEDTSGGQFLIVILPNLFVFELSVLPDERFGQDDI